MKELDLDNLPEFKMPEEIFEQLYNLIGGTEESSKGFLIAYTNQHGEPVIHAKASNQIVQMGLIKAVETFLIQVENHEDIPPQED